MLEKRALQLAGMTDASQVSSYAKKRDREENDSSPS